MDWDTVVQLSICTVERGIFSNVNLRFFWHIVNVYFFWGKSKERIEVRFSKILSIVLSSSQTGSSFLA